MRLLWWKKKPPVSPRIRYQEDRRCNPRPTNDPFEVIGPIPIGVTYQWASTAVLGDSKYGHFDKMISAGWTVVPPSRHPKMRSIFDKMIVVGDQVLVERSKALTDAARLKETDAARGQFEEHPARGGAPLRPGGSAVKSIRRAADPAKRWEWGDAQREQILSFTANRYGKRGTCGEFKYVEVDIKIGVALTDGEIESAEFLHIEPKEFGRRKLLQSADVIERLDRPPGAGARNDDVPVFRFVRLTTESE